MTLRRVFWSLVIFLAFGAACAPRTPVVGYGLPAGLALGDIEGSGAEALRLALSPLLDLGPTDRRLSGVAQWRPLITEGREETLLERTTVLEETETYEPDPFTGILWKVPATRTERYTAEFPVTRIQGELDFEYAVTPLGAPDRPLAAGRLTISLSRSSGGYPDAAAGKPRIETAELAETLLRDAGRALARKLALALGRRPAPEEIADGPDPLSRKACELARADRWDEAEKIWQELLSQNPNYAPVLYNTGLCRERRGLLAEARSYYRAAYRADPRPLYRQALARTAGQF